MRIKRAKNAGHDSALSSMSDIAFLLIIFFMTASAFVFKNGLHLSLPDKDAKPVVMGSDEVLTLEVAGNGDVTVNRETVEVTGLAQFLSAMNGDDLKKTALIKIDRTTGYSTVITVIDSVRSAGISRLSLKMTGGKSL